MAPITWRNRSGRPGRAGHASRRGGRTPRGRRAAAPGRGVRDESPRRPTSSPSWTRARRSSSAGCCSPSAPPTRSSARRATTTAGLLGSPGRRPHRRHRQLPLRHPRVCGSVAAVAGDLKTPGVAGPGRGGRDLALRRVYHGALGGGAYERGWDELSGTAGALLRVGSVDALSGALVGTGFGYTPRRRTEQGLMLLALLPQVRDIRRIGRSPSTSARWPAVAWTGSTSPA